MSVPNMSELTDSQRVEKFIAKATGKTLGRNKKSELATMFFNAYGEYVKTLKQLNLGYTVFKEQENLIKIMKRQRDHYHKIIRFKNHKCNIDGKEYVKL